MTYPPMGGPGPGYPPPGGPNDPATVALAQVQKRSRRRLTIILASVVVVLALVLAFAVNQVYFNKTGKTLIPGLALRSATDPGPDPFTDSVALVNKTQPAPTRVNTAQDNGVRVVNGTEPGLYATTGTASCDTAALGNQLASNPGAARAWAAVQGIRTSDIPWYLNSLTPVVLTADTWVTNYSYRSGNAVAYQAVLQSGTPVYVDAAGVPRAVCACGNPLRPPAAAPVGGYRIIGERWPGYTVNNTYRVTYNNTYVTNNTIVNEAPPAPAPDPVLQLIDLTSQQIVEQPAGGNLELPDQPPADTPNFFERAFAENVAPTFDSDEAAREQGLAAAGSTEPAEAVVQRAVQNDNQPDAAPDGTEAADQPGAPAPDAPADSTSAAASSSAAAVEPTQFRGTGDAIGTLIYREGDGRTVTCTLPTTFESATVAATNSDCTLTFERNDLLQARVNATVAADSDRVWKITPIGRSTPIEVVQADWQTLVTVTSSTTTPTTTTTEAPVTTTETPEPTSEAPTPEATQSPAAEPTPSTAVPSS
ncbi:DUF6777 domain-containing protein [Gordonia caeni]|uniref:DUF6777 domain-containing protein n=1 Tax=Gordonia caeni TaxID=1007097 RepID=A0ABP7NJC7_9ACTN